ncbi:MAG: Gfo/Idh/MocA family oxidoreductase, partial [Planctomycetia bacterium]|nr:Gfo/Idh/MocA family oxidoreductase [Planctomycetia bacterium]
RQAREMVLNGELGEINAIRSNYIQGWLRTRLEKDDQKQAKWRTDPKQSGAAGCFGDIGTHAYNLGRYITGLQPKELSCNLKIFESGRALDDYGVAVIRYENGAIGTVTASQISHGRENDIFIEIDGTKAALEWHQEEPNKLFVRKNGEPHKTYTRNGGGYLGALAGASSRLPSGHPEAFFEAFANIYNTAYDAIVKRAGGEKFELVNTIYPNIYDGVEGMLFITKCVESSKQNGGWVSFRHPKSRK